MEKFGFAVAYLHTLVTTPKREEKGATAVEYGLLVALIAAVLVGVIGFLGQDIGTAFQTVVTAIPGGNA